MSQQVEVLSEQYSSKSAALPVVRQAQKHYREAKRATIQVMADLRRLQDGGVHLLYGERNFAQWAERTFEGLSAGNVKQLTRAGEIALELERHKRLDLKAPSGVGTTGLRELSVISNEYGVEKMIEVFDTAKGMLEDGQDVSSTTVKAAMHLLMPPPEPRVEEPDALPGADDDEGSEDDVDGPVTRSELEERVSHIQDLLWDVGTGDKSAYSEAMDEMVRLGRVLKDEATPEDEAWLNSSR
jgi:hypothetical protein